MGFPGAFPQAIIVMFIGFSWCIFTSHHRYIYWLFQVHFHKPSSLYLMACPGAFPQAINVMFIGSSRRVSTSHHRYVSFVFYFCANKVFFIPFSLDRAQISIPSRQHFKYCWIDLSNSGHPREIQSFKIVSCNGSIHAWALFVSCLSGFLMNSSE